MGFNWKHTKEVVIGVLILSNIFTWFLVFSSKSNAVLSVYFFDVGQGDAFFIESPTKGRILIDGGPDRTVLSHLGRVLPFGDKRIDVVIATHPDRDHIAGLPEVIEYYEVGVFLEPGIESENTIDDALHNRLERKGVTVIRAERGMWIDLGDGVKFFILSPKEILSTEDTNDSSVVGKLVYEDQSFLFTGDSSFGIERSLLKDVLEVLDSDVLKVAHHGSKTSTSLEYAKSVSPKYSVVSVGKDNKYGHPNEEVLKRLEGTGSEIKSTALGGTLLFQTDGSKLWVK